MELPGHQDGGGSAPGSTFRVRARFAAGGLLAAGTLTATSASAQSNVGFPRPIGTWTAGGQAAGGPVGGPLVEVEGGGSFLTSTGSDPARASFTFGSRAGWAFAQGVAVHIRYDDLGVRPVAGSSPLQFATAGLRYSAPFIVPLPFAEVDAGAALVAKGVAVGGSGGIGISVPIGSHVVVDAVGRDWLVPIAGVLRQTFTASLGLTVTFASPSR